MSTHLWSKASSAVCKMVSSWRGSCFLLLFVSWFQLISHQSFSLWLHLVIRDELWWKLGLSQLLFLSLFILPPSLWQRWITNVEIRSFPSSRSFLERTSPIFDGLRQQFLQYVLPNTITKNLSHKKWGDAIRLWRAECQVDQKRKHPLHYLWKYKVMQ